MVPLNRMYRGCCFQDVVNLASKFNSIVVNPYVHGSFTEPMPHGCGQICPQDLWVKLPTPVKDGCQTLISGGGIISGCVWSKV
jgi:hypothetical protein